MTEKLSDCIDDDLIYIHENFIERSELDNAVIIITGCSGFLGFYFLQYLLKYSSKLGIKKIIGLDIFRLNRPQWIDDLIEQYVDIFDLLTFDITKDDLYSIKNVLDTTHIIHMASIASPIYYRKFPIETMDANVYGLRNLLELSLDLNNIRSILFFSSSEVYGDPDPAHIPTTEDYPGRVSCLGPRACYDESKRYGETLCYNFNNSYGMPIKIIRPFNNYGPGMSINDRRVPADFAKAVLENRDIEILSDGSPKRTFCYISDAIVGYLKALVFDKFDVFNIGIDKPEISILELAEVYKNLASELFNHNLSVRFLKSTDINYLVDNPNRRCPDISKARRLLGFEPKVLVNQGVYKYLMFLKRQGM